MLPLVKSFRELEVYKRTRSQARAIFQVTKHFPSEERFSLTDQVRRSSRAVGAMLAEAWAKRRYPAAVISKLDDALGEAMETQAWLDYAYDCGYIDAQQHAALDDQWQQIGAMIGGMMGRAADFCRGVAPATARIPR